MSIKMLLHYFPTTSYVILLLLLASSCSNAAAARFEPDPETQTLIDKICRQMEVYGYCNDLFRENLPAPHTDILGLTQITIKESILTSTNTVILIRTLSQNETNPAMIEHYTLCSSTYKKITENFGNAYYSFLNKAYSRIPPYERPCAELQFTCATDPVPGGTGKYHLLSNNVQMRRLITMALVTVDLIGAKI